ncbi:MULTISPECIES: DNA cytosine methyltransferase [unclassified Rhizobium]|uniref:DNA cytosine methyltransferase n=1 Tax=unclassified Rhizobium TaxID=2613769 RepID=UPI0017815322|nr:MULTISPECIES: DNA cytosine methyltransferase [unclassified Rhizobium]MBD8687196.1 DNA cytosine methyltransferase [Rhizobium sp. CFBP 13644]MBD8691001.1 DNA cytosine methyltransferase [Rhizobium sp. CFBP 13717]
MIAYDKHDIEDVLKDAAKTITDSMRVIADSYLKAADAAAALRKIHGWNDLLPLLASRTNIETEDLVVLQGVAAAFEGHRNAAREAALSIDVMKQLSQASDVVRIEAFDLISRGRTLKSSDLSNIVGKQDRASPSERAERRRADYLEARAWRNIESSVDDLQYLVDRLVHLLHGFVLDFVEPDDGSSESNPAADPRFQKAGQAIRAVALEAALKLETLFCVDADAATLYDEQNAKLSATRQTLRALATLDTDTLSGADFTAIQTDLEYLTSESFVEGSPHVTRDRPEAPLKVLELCAGAGGSSLGLMAAGFEHVSLIERKRKAAATLKTNWPTWPVKQRNAKSLSDDFLAKFRGIDLLAAGLPCGPGESRTDAEDLWPEMARIIQGIRPRSFLLEHDAGQRQDTDHLERGRNLARLRDLQYEVLEFNLDPMDFGIPSSRRRYFVVGILSEISGVFVVPAVKGGDELALKRATAVSYMMTPHESPAVAQSAMPSAIGPLTQQQGYDRWAKHWRSVRRPGFLPGTLAKEEKKQPEAWTKAGFLVSEVVDDPPAVSDVVSVDFLPKMTFDVLAAAQGFPPGWKFQSKKAGKLDMIQAALPPVVAKMVGLAICSALTGRKFNLEEELNTPIVDVSLLGIGPRRSPPLRKTRGFAGTELFHQIDRLLDGEQIGVVEPNRTRWDKVLKPLLQDIRTAQADALRRGTAAIKNRFLP